VSAIHDIGGILTMDIKDNGKGFEGLEGTYDGSALQTFDIGPRSLRARVVELGGALSLETSASGSRLKIQVPLK
jgi:signal transduction histidine kinase